MAGTAINDLPSADRALPLRRRNDLLVRPLDSAGGDAWVVKDPLTSDFHHLGRVEYEIWQQLDGKATPRQLIRRFADTYAPRRLTHSQLQAMLARFHQSGLVVSNRPGQGEQLQTRARRERYRAWKNLPFQLLAMRWPGIDPGRLLDRLLPFARCLFQPVVVAATVAIGLVLAGWLAWQFPLVQQRLPDVSRFRSTINWFWLAIAIACTKVLHELGHGLCCHFFGGRARELGVMLLCFTPCLYCDVSDAWLFSNRWQRMAVSAAGMYLELILATVCGWLWWFSVPGPLNSFCFHILLVCGVGTLGLNGNPLMRYDGYFLFSDWCGIPNLDGHARDQMRRWFLAAVLGAGDPRPDWGSVPRQTLVSVYAIASTIYRILVVGAIIWGLHRWLAPYQLDAVVRGVAIVLAGGMLAVPVHDAWQQLQNPSLARRIRWRQVALRVFAAAIAVTVVLSIPWPARVVAPAWLEPEKLERVFVTQPGRLRQALPDGTRVTAGQELASLENTEITRERVELEAELERIKARRSSLEAQRVSSPRSSAQLGSIARTQEAVSLRLTQLRDDENRLTLRAGMSGQWISPPRRAIVPSKGGPLETWSGSPLEPQARGAWLEIGTLLGRVVATQSWTVVAVVDQESIALMRTGQSVQVHLWQAGNDRIPGEVVDISMIPAEEIPEMFARSQLISARPDPSGRFLAASPHYEVRIRLKTADPRWRAGGRADCRIHVAPRSLGRRLHDFWRKTFS